MDHIRGSDDFPLLRSHANHQSCEGCTNFMECDFHRPHCRSKRILPYEWMLRRLGPATPQCPLFVRRLSVLCTMEHFFSHHPCRVPISSPYIEPSAQCCHHVAAHIFPALDSPDSLFSHHWILLRLGIIYQVNCFAIGLTMQSK